MIVNGGLGNDTLTVNLGGVAGAPVRGITFNGGENGGDDDRLTITNGGAGAGTLTVTHTGAEAGTVNLGNASNLISFSEIEPLFIDVASVDLIVNLPTGSANTGVVLGDDGVSPDVTNDANKSAIYDGTGPASFEYTEFTNPTNSITINRGTASDTITVNGVSASGLNAAALTVGSGASPFSSVTVNGTNTLASGKSVSIGATTLTVDGTITTSGAGTVSVAADNAAINNTISSAGSVSFTTASANRNIVLGSDGITLSLTDAELDRVTAGSLSITATGTGGVTVTEAITRPSATAVGISTGSGNVSILGASSRIDTSGGSLTVTTTGSITSDATTALAGSTITINGPAVSIGTSTNPIAISATSLSSTSTGAQSFSTSGSVSLTSVAGSSLTLKSGTFTIPNSEVISNSAALSVEGATLALGTFNETVNGVTLKSGSITGSGTLTSSGRSMLKAVRSALILPGPLV